MDQFGYAFLNNLQYYSYFWSIFRYFRPSSLGFLLEQSSEIIEIITLHDDTTPKMSYACARPKEKAAAALTPQPETTQRRQPYHIPLRTPISHELPPM